MKYGPSRVQPPSENDLRFCCATRCDLGETPFLIIGESDGEFHALFFRVRAASTRFTVSSTVSRSRLRTRWTVRRKS